MPPYLSFRLSGRFFDHNEGDQAGSFSPIVGALHDDSSIQKRTETSEAILDLGYQHSIAPDSATTIHMSENPSALSVERESSGEMGVAGWRNPV